MIRNKNVLWTPLRLRRLQVADLEPFIVLTAPAFNAQLQQWNRAGGVCVYERNYVSWEDVAAHQAQLVSECPSSVDLLDRYLEGTRELAVVYRPPNWDSHRKWIACNYPPAELAERFYELVLAAQPDEAMGEALQLEPGFRALGDAEARKALGIHVAVLKVLRRTLFRRRSLKLVWRATLRVEPEDRTLAEVYRYIAEQCPNVGGVHFVTGATLMKKVRFWKKALRSLERCGAIGVKGLATCYWPEELPPHFLRLDSRRARAERQLQDVIELVESSPEFTPVKASPRSPARQAKSLSVCA